MTKQLSVPIQRTPWRIRRLVSLLVCTRKGHQLAGFSDTDGEHLVTVCARCARSWWMPLPSSVRLSHDSQSGVDRG